MRVNVFEQETHQAGAAGFRAEKPDIFQRGQFFAGVGRQFLVVLPDVFPANGVEVIHCGVQTNRAGNVRRAGLEPVRRVLELGLLIFDRQNHFTAALIRRHGVEQFLPSPQHADAGRPADFVAGEREEIAADGLHVHRTMPGALRGVHERRDAELPRAGAQVGNRIHRAQRV